jgi:predicted GNAT family acetyltransferase
MEKDKLDNPSWYALSEDHQDFAVGYDGIKFYQPDYCPFGGFENPDATEDGIDAYASLTNTFFVIGKQPRFSGRVQRQNELVCNQMILKNRIARETDERITELKTDNHKADLFGLVNLVQPGYFRASTSDLGNYYGIYKGNMLVAVAGERMKMTGFTELSAIVTHPAHTGKGYAKQLITHASHAVFNEGKIPYLHVTTNNAGAIRLYEKLGFTTRRKISFWHFTICKN